MKPTDTNDYTSATATVQINVKYADQMIPTITWANPADIFAGNAAGCGSTRRDGLGLGAFTYTPKAGTVLGVGPNQTLSVTFTPNDTTRYSSTTATVRIFVDPPSNNKTTPTITWASPGDITYGTPLRAQLDATASVPGVFTYTPAGGIILSVGA